MSSKTAKTSSPSKQSQQRLLSRTGTWLQKNGLSIVTILVFVLCWIGQSIAGFLVHNEEAKDHQRQEITYVRYLQSSAFWEATTENWESEYLQLGAMVILTVFLRQKGSAESKPEEAVASREARPKVGTDWKRLLYENSLSLTLVALFLACFAGHTWSSFYENNSQRQEHGQPKQTLYSFMKSPQLWFESLQNWQSEFLAVSSLTLLSIVLRQKGSAESKEPDQSNSTTGK